MSQIFDVGLSFYFMLKNGKIWVIFSYFIFYISLNNNENLFKKKEKDLGHSSLHLNIIYEYLKLYVSKHIMKRESLVPKIYVEKSFFKFLTLKLNNLFIHDYMIYIAW